MKKTIPIIILLASFSLLMTASVFAQFKSRTYQPKKPTDRVELRFGKVEAISDGNGVLLLWETSFESKNLGFEVFRSTSAGWKKVGPSLIPGGYLSVDRDATYGRDYRQFDPEGGFGTPYLVRARSLSGRYVSSSLLYPRYAANFEYRAGADSVSLANAAAASKPVIDGFEPAQPFRKRTSVASDSLTPSQAGQHWVAAQPGVKIGVKQEGIYRVSRTELLNAGFDVNTDESLWQLYLDGNQQAIIVGANGDYIEFYGRPIDTRYTDENIYFLVVGPAAGMRIPEIVRTSTGGGQVQSYREEFYRRDRSLYVTGIKNGEKENFFGQVISSSGITENFTIDEIDYSNLKASVKVGVQGFTTASHTVSISINGVPLGNASFFGQGFVELDAGVASSILLNGSNTITLSTLGGGADLALVEYIRVNFKRNLKARSNELRFPVGQDQNAIVGGFSESDVRVFDITDPDSPTIVQNIQVSSAAKLVGDFTVSIPSNSAAMMFSATGSALKTVNSITLNTPSTLSSAGNGADMVIISNGAWMTEAGQWAAYRSGDGINSIVVDVDEVFDEFGYGRPGSEAIREFINYAILNWSTAPGYVMLLGDASYDPRNYRGLGFHDYVPTGLIETTYDETASDEYLADFDDDGLSEVSIARIPARNSTQVTQMLAKVTAFEQSLGTAPARGSLCVTDIPDIWDYVASCAAVQATLPMTIPASAVNRGDVNSKVTLMNELNAGKYIVNYSGHGNRTNWAVSTFFTTNDVPNLTNGGNLSILTMLTCLNGYFIEPAADSMAEVLLRATNGGGAATWASTGKTTPDVQDTLATRFYDQLGNNAAMTRIGDLVRDAKTAIPSGRDVRLSWTLFGDPAMKVK